MEELGIIIPKEVSHREADLLSQSLYESVLFMQSDELDTKAFVVSNQNEQIENDDLYTKFKVRFLLTRH